MNSEVENYRNIPAIASHVLWDSLGNRASISMYRIGPDTFEIYTQAMQSAVPGRFVGTLGECNARADRWIETIKAAGFQEQLPSFNPDAWKP